ncbi:hypothetical protein IFR05_005109 [Cadophora sp. M221]|nr:hypothetical protein IFR05_005109 [Cadophora sp. M221]
MNKAAEEQHAADKRYLEKRLEKVTKALEESERSASVFAKMERTSIRSEIRATRERRLARAAAIPANRVRNTRQISRPTPRSPPRPASQQIQRPHPRPHSRSSNPLLTTTSSTRAPSSIPAGVLTSASTSKRNIPTTHRPTLYKNALGITMHASKKVPK